MATNRKTATLVGVLYIIATAAGVLSVIFMPALDDQDYLTKMSAEETRMIIGISFYFIMAVAVAAIAIVLYPVLKKHNETLALGNVCARLIEGTLFLVHIITILALLTLSQEFVEADMPSASHFQATGELLQSVGHWAGEVVVGIIFPLSALIFYYLLYQTRLVPRWLSSWGLIGAILYPAAALALLGSPTSDILYAPLALNEMVLALWLIIKGFNPPEITSESAQEKEEK
jgi:hypothetical protein